MEMQNKEFLFEDGLKTYTINKKVNVQFNPTDVNFAESAISTFDELDEQQEKLKAETKNCNGMREIFDVHRKYDTQAREKIDGLFNQPVCTALFGEMSVFAAAEGLPIWCNLMLAIIDEIDDGIMSERKKTDARVRKYTQKYENRK